MVRLRTNHAWTLGIILVLGALSVALGIINTVRASSSVREPQAALTWPTIDGIQATITVPRKPGDDDDAHAARTRSIVNAFKVEFPNTKEQK